MWRACRYNDGYHRDHPVIKRFWQIVEEDLDDSQRTALIRFAWGRSRVPQKANWDQNFQISSTGNALPRAHTCFFRIDLPAYVVSERDFHECSAALTVFGAGLVVWLFAVTQVQDEGRNETWLACSHHLGSRRHPQLVML